MRTVNIHQAKTQLSKLVEEAAKGEPFVIAKAGKPMVKVTALDVPVGKKMQRFGFMKGEISVPDDFDRVFDAEIEELFGLNELPTRLLTVEAASRYAFTPLGRRG